MALVELGSGGSDDEERNTLGPVGKVLQEPEQRLIGPMEVLEDQHSRAFVGKVLEKAAPGCE